MDQKEEAKEAKVQPKPMNIPPTRKVAYRADDLKVGDKLIVYLPTKKGSYLGEVRKIWLPVEEAPEDTEKWIRVHLCGRIAPGSPTFAPWWIDGRKQCFLKRASHHGPLWEDVYASWVRYKLEFPMEDGQLHSGDEAKMTLLWGRTLKIQ